MRTRNFNPRPPRITLFLAAFAMSAISIAASIVLPAVIALDAADAAPASCVQARVVTDHPTT